MGENTSQIEREIVAERAELGRNLEELESRARAMADWRHHYRNHTGLAVAIAFGAGATLGLLAMPGDDSWSGAEPIGGAHEWEDQRGATGERANPRRLRSSLAALGSTATVNRAREHAGETCQRITDGLVGFASARLLALLTELIPGIQPHLDGSARRQT